jgi:hypothetical protein
VRVASSHHEWLLSQLPEWEREGLLTAESAAVLRQRAQAAVARGGQLGLVIFGGLGAVLVAGGVIALLAHNWDALPRWVRLILAFAPMLAGQALAAWVVRGGAAIAAWIREAVAVFLALSAGTCLAIVAQIYSMGGEWETLLLAWCLLAVPVLWLLRSDLLATLYVIGISVWVQASSEWWGGHLQSERWFWYPLLLVPLLGWWPGTKWRDIQAPPLGFRWVAALCFMMDTAARSHFPEMPSLLSLSAVYVLLPEPEGSLWRRPFAVTGSLVLASWGLALCDRSWYIEGAGELFMIQHLWILAVFIIALAVPAVRRRRWASLALASVVLLPLPPYMLHPGWHQRVSSGPPLPFHAFLGANLWIIAGLQLVLTGVLMVLPAFKGREGSPRLGALLISAVVLSQFTNSELPLTGKGLGFIVVGTGFIVFNILLARSRRPPLQP